MKRIKLFEAFSNGDKVEKVNHFLFCWCIKEFIKNEQLRPAIRRNHFTLYDFCSYFDYNFRYDEVDIYCLSYLKQFFIEKFIPSFIVTFNETAIQKAAKQIIKKMYQDEKNKTI
jgi:hypothetical protein